VESVLADKNRTQQKRAASPPGTAGVRIVCSAVRKRGRWLKSEVLGRAFRLSRQTDPLGQPAFTLEAR
jgi:hypothetical protein